MTIVSNDPDWWPAIYFFRGVSYVTVASFIVVFYDWGTQEITIEKIIDILIILCSTDIWTRGKCRRLME
ncbi:hypothetical protein AZE42_02281 [Rhizopogon vesiculosus]|uniref:Uncharacterized protein n=1 Tax=Rhizopogon vesiculosus TaxID=180088 RepID=A0A1J8QVC1_9AGAM|nr:hypothetical protein AZE42_02281 [Rhizopogon vesiculosus]